MQKMQDELHEQLCKAAERGDVNLCRQLIDAGADVNWSCDNSPLAIHWAAFYGRVDVMRVLLDAGADINAATVFEGRPAGKRPLEWALIQKVPLSTIKFMLDAGADPNKSNSRFDWPLLSAVTLEQYDVAKLLVEHGAKSSHLPADSIGTVRTAFQAAVYHRQEKFIDLFVRSCGEDVDQVTLQGETMYDLCGADTRICNQLRALKVEMAVTVTLGLASGYDPDFSTAPIASRAPAL